MVAALAKSTKWRKIYGKNRNLKGFAFLFMSLSKRGDDFYSEISRNGVVVMVAVMEVVTGDGACHLALAIFYCCVFIHYLLRHTLGNYFSSSIDLISLVKLLCFNYTKNL